MGSHQKKEKNFTTIVNYGGGQQFLLCEPQKSAFFRANFPKNMLKLIHNAPFVCPDAGFHLCILPFKIMLETGWCRLAWIEVGALRKVGLLGTNLRKLNSTVTNF